MKQQKRVIFRFRNLIAYSLFLIPHIVCAMSEVSTQDDLRESYFKGEVPENLGREALADFLCWAVYDSDEHMIERILKINLENEIGLDKIYLDFDGSTDNSYMHLASKIGDPAIVQLLGTYDMGVDLPNSKGETPLHVAVEHDKAEVVEALTTLGASMTLQDKSGNTALDMALQMRKFKCIIALCEAQYNCSTVESAYTESPECFKVLLKFRADRTFARTKGEALIKRIIEEKSTEYLKLLLKYNALDDFSISFETCVGMRNYKAFHHAAHVGDKEVVACFLEYDADKHQCSIDRFTPLHAAVNGRNLSAVEVLCEGGVDLNFQDKDWNSPLLVALIAYSISMKNETIDEIGKRLEIIKFLIEQGASLEQVEGKWRNALFQFLSSNVSFRFELEPEALENHLTLLKNLLERCRRVIYTNERNIGLLQWLSSMGSSVRSSGPRKPISLYSLAFCDNRKNYLARFSYLVFQPERSEALVALDRFAWTRYLLQSELKEAHRRMTNISLDKVDHDYMSSIILSDVDLTQDAINIMLSWLADPSSGFFCKQARDPQKKVHVFLSNFPVALGEKLVSFLAQQWQRQEGVKGELELLSLIKIGLGERIIELLQKVGLTRKQASSNYIAQWYLKKY